MKTILRFIVQLEDRITHVHTQRAAMRIFETWGRGDTVIFFELPGGGELDVSHEIYHGLPLSIGGDRGLDYVHTVQR